MKRRLILTAIIIISSLCAWAKDTDAPATERVTADKCLQVAPAAIFDMIEPNTRLDMIDYFKAGSDRHSRNTLGGDCYITADTDYSLEMVGGTDISYQIFVLNPDDACPIIGVIETLSTPQPDSRIRFYDCRWNPLLRLVWTPPTLTQWLKKDAKKKTSTVEDQIPFIMASYKYDPDTRSLTVTNNMDSYYLSEDTPEAMSYLHNDLTYIWDGNKFKLQK